MQQFLNFKELQNGNLKITLTKEGREELKELIESKTKDRITWKKDTEAVWLDLLEYGACNGSYQYLHPEKIAALTDSPIIGLNVDYDEDGELEENDDLKVWWYPNYMVVDELKELLARGVVFEKA